MTLASKLTERVTIQQRLMSDDGFGGKTISWSDVITVFAQVEPIYSVAFSERVVGEQISAIGGYRVMLRYRADISASMRLVWKGRLLLIHSLHESDQVLSLLTYEENL
jgi:SPP1 family predicted phage head-tail adaptor